MKKYLLFCLFCFLLPSCQKKNVIEKNAKVIKSTEDLKELFQLKNYKNIVKKIINDSITHITAEHNYIKLNGDFNTKKNSKTGVWSLTNKTDSKEIQIDYVIFGKNDDFENQIIFKEHGKIDSGISKFFIVQHKSLQRLKLKFFSPEIKNEISKEATIKYRVYRKKKVINEDSIIYRNSKTGQYLADIKFDLKKGDYITGYLTELVRLGANKKKDSLFMGENSMYFIEDFD